MSLSTINLVYSYIGKLIDTRSTAAPVVLPSTSFDLVLLKAIDLELIRDRQTPAISGDMAKCMARNIPVKTKENLRTDMQHTRETVAKDCTIFTRRLGD